MSVRNPATVCTGSTDHQQQEMPGRPALLRPPLWCYSPRPGVTVPPWCYPRPGVTAPALVLQPPPWCYSPALVLPPPWCYSPRPGVTQPWPVTPGKTTQHYRRLGDNPTTRPATRPATRLTRRAIWVQSSRIPSTSMHIVGSLHAHCDGHRKRC